VELLDRNDVLPHDARNQVAISDRRKILILESPERGGGFVHLDLTRQDVSAAPYSLLFDIEWRRWRFLSFRLPQKLKHRFPPQCISSAAFAFPSYSLQRLPPYAFAHVPVSVSLFNGGSER
jgi:hypothetical protein